MGAPRVPHTLQARLCSLWPPLSQGTEAALGDPCGRPRLRRESMPREFNASGRWLSELIVPTMGLRGPGDTLLGAPPCADRGRSEPAWPPLSCPRARHTLGLWAQQEPPAAGGFLPLAPTFPDWALGLQGLPPFPAPRFRVAGRQLDAVGSAQAGAAAPVGEGSGGGGAARPRVSLFSPACKYLQPRVRGRRLLALGPPGP